MNNTVNIKASSQKHATREKLIACLVAVAFLFNSICLLANILFPSVDNFGEIFVIFILVLGLAACITPSVRINFNLLFLNAIILLAVFASYLYYDFSDIVKSLMINYISWGIGVTVIMMQKYNLRRVLNISYWISFFIILCELLTNAEKDYDILVWTYSIFPCIAISVIHFAYCRHRKFIFKITYIPCFVMMIKFMLNANRGGIVSILALFFFISIKSVNSAYGRVKNRKMLGLILLIFALFVGLFFEPIVSFLYNWAESMSFNVESLEKMYRLIETGNIINNRKELYACAWNGFLESPIIGNGVGGFSVKYGTWTHNFILQLLYEGGILLAPLVLVPLIENCLFVLKEKRITGDEYSLFVLFFSASVPRLLISTELWNTQSFWMLFAFCMLIRNKYKSHHSDSAR